MFTKKIYNDLKSMGFKEFSRNDWMEMAGSIRIKLGDEELEPLIKQPEGDAKDGDVVITIDGYGLHFMKWNEADGEFGVQVGINLEETPDEPIGWYDCFPAAEEQVPSKEEIIEFLKPFKLQVLSDDERATISPQTTIKEVRMYYNPESKSFIQRIGIDDLIVVNTWERDGAHFRWKFRTKAGYEYIAEFNPVTIGPILEKNDKYPVDKELFGHIPVICLCK